MNIRRIIITVLAVFAVLWATPKTAICAQMFASVNAVPYANGGSFVYQYDSADSTGDAAYTTFLSNLDHPRGLAFDSTGNLYVATFTWALDSDGNILDVDHAAVVKVSGGIASTFATFFGGTATGLVIDSNDNVFVSSQLNGGNESTIYKVTYDGTVSTFGSVPGQCFGLAFDSAGNLLAQGADSTLTQSIIYRFTSLGARSIFIEGTSFPSAGAQPIGLAFDAFGNLFISTQLNNTSNGEIRRFDPNGAEITPPFATGLTNAPRGLAFDSSNGNLFLAGPGYQAAIGNILKFTPDGAQTIFASSGFGFYGNRGPEFLAFAPPAVTVTPPSTAVTLAFPDATEALATTVVSSIDQNSVPPPPPNFELNGTNLAYNIAAPTGEPTPPIIIGITVPSTLYNQYSSILKVMHYENSNWVDKTINKGDPNYPATPAPYTIYGSVDSLSPFLVTKFKYQAQVQQPVNADGTSVFPAKRGVVPIAFKLTSDGVATCQLPPATISVFRTSGGVVGSIDESTYLLKSDSGSNFRIDSTKCQYVYNLGASSLGPGTYTAYISIGGSVAGSGTFALK